MSAEVRAPIGRAPDGVAWQDGRAYSANGRNRTISMVAANEAGHLGWIEIIASARGARTIAADPVPHTLFSATADLKPQAATLGQGPKRPEPVPDTLRVLVLGRQVRLSAAIGRWRSEIVEERINQGPAVFLPVK